MIQTIKMNLDDMKHLASIAKALSSETRIEILRHLRHKDLNVNEIAELLDIPASSSAAHVKVLEEAGMIKTSLQPGIRGSMKLCHIVLDHIYVEMNTMKNLEQVEEVIKMPIGSFTDYKIEPTCGIVSNKGPIGSEDEPRCFYLPERVEAQLIWLGNGYIEYRFPTNTLADKDMMRLEISMELCSEDHEYNMHYSSDITLWVNQLEVGTWTCPSDFGGRRGNLNPDWWPDKNTQYGMLKTWRITEQGCYLDEEKSSARCLKEFSLSKQDYISVRIGIKEDANNKGGMNLFGEGFGDFEQNIVMKIVFQ
ncbi:MAG: transcriptional regulator [Herbinix sp.]|jgi:predicted transcriptional regulator|nr:transcriptional regulator [Herbinix sp.]